MGVVLGAALSASSAGAQDQSAGAPEDVIVHPPRPAPGRSSIGAPIIDASMSVRVRTDDLDLRTEAGARELENRVRFAARALCGDLDTLYPATYQDPFGTGPRSRDCNRNATERGMANADAAIRAARGYGGY
jgi:UrcA family protein